MAFKVLIVGGVAGGASAAARLRRLDEAAEIILFEKGAYISFANCGLPYYIGEVIQDKDKLLVQTPEKMKERFRIDVRIQSEVTKIDPLNKKIEVKNLITGQHYTEAYDKLILSPGAEPMRPNLPGMACPRIFTLRNIPDTFAIKDYVDGMKPKSAVIVGAGFIGLEVAENLHARGMQVSVVELSDHVIGPLDFDMAAIVHQHIKNKGVKLYLGDGVKAFSHTATLTTVELSGGKSIQAEMVLLGIGVRPESKLAKEAGLKIGKTGGIVVNKRMQTSDEHIFAVGDAVEVMDFTSGEPVLIPLAGPANKQGRIAADNICGRATSYAGTQGTAIVKVFDTTVALTGNNESVLKKRGQAYEKVYIHAGSHAGYYPGALPMAMKLLFDKQSGQIFGAAIVGYDGVDKRMDVLSTAIRAGMTVHDLEKLELAYAPPYSSAKDPVNLLGFAAANIVKGDVSVIHWHDIEKRDKESTLLVDVRTPMEFELGSIPGAVNIPLDVLREHLHELSQEKEIWLFCQVGLRGYVASRILMQHGYAKVRNLSGGFKTYVLATEKDAAADIYEHDKIMKDDALQPVDDAGDASSEKPMEINACGLQCPGPILAVYQAIQSMNDGELLRVQATDPGFESDIKAWCDKTGNKLLSLSEANKTFTAVIKKRSVSTGREIASGKHDKTFVVFSNDLDKAIATFIIANGAAAMGRKVTLFFTFWGLNILRKTEGAPVKKDLISQMFGWMMPKGSAKLSLSKMNMGGMGAYMIRYLMKKKRVASLEELMEQAKKNGVQLIACNMSMDIMGIRKEELIDGVTLGGVAAFLGAAEESDMSLFI